MGIIFLWQCADGILLNSCLLSSAPSVLNLEYADEVIICFVLATEKRNNWLFWRILYYQKMYCAGWTLPLRHVIVTNKSILTAIYVLDVSTLHTRVKTAFHIVCFKEIDLLVFIFSPFFLKSLYII